MFRPISLAGFQRFVPRVARHQSAAYEDIKGGIDRQPVRYRLFFQHPADRPRHGIAIFHRLHLFFQRGIGMDQHRHPRLGGGVVVFADEAYAAGALFPGNGAHGVLAGIRTVPRCQNWVLIQKAVDRQFPQKAAHGCIQCRQKPLLGRDDQLLQGGGPPGLFTHPEKVAAAQIQRLQQIPSPAGKTHFQVPGCLLMGFEPGDVLDRVSFAQNVLLDTVRILYFKGRMQVKFQRDQRPRPALLVAQRQMKADRLAGFGQQIFRHHPGLQAVQCVFLGICLERQHQDHQHSRKYQARHSASSGTEMLCSSCCIRWAAASAFMPPPRVRRWHSTAGASSLMSSGMT